MKRYHFLWLTFHALSVILFGAMCAVVSYDYCDMSYRIRYQGASAPADVAFLYAIPFGAAIAVCVIVSFVFYRKFRQTAALQGDTGEK